MHVFAFPSWHTKQLFNNIYFVFRLLPFKFLQINLKILSVKQQGAQILQTAHGREDRKHISPLPTTLQSTGEVLGLGHVKLSPSSHRSMYICFIFNTCSIISENGTQILSHQKQESEKITIPRAKIDENTKYQLIITAYNHFGASQSDPFILCVKDIGKLSFLLHLSLVYI